MSHKISTAVINRLPRYYRYLGDLQEEGITKISSKQLAERMNLTASQIRQDLNCFGGFGQQGYGYRVEYLLEEIANILGINNKYKSILIGCGKMGRALVNRITFTKRGFELIGIFDNDPKVVGTIVGGHTVKDVAELEEFCLEQKPEAAFLALPREVAPETAAKLEKLGIKGFWNFSSGYIVLENRDIPVENVHLGDSLMSLSCRMKTIK